MLRSGARWSDLPERYGKWKTVHERFGRWTKSGVWERVFDSLTGDPDNQYLMLDTTLVRAHPAGRDWKRGDQNQALGRSRGGLSSKIHALADASGRPLRFIITAGQTGDITQAPALLSSCEAGGVDRGQGLDSNALRTLIAEIGSRNLSSPAIRPASSRPA